MTDTPEQSREEPHEYLSPDEELALEIAQALIEVGLIREAKGDPLKQGIRAGNLRSEDWRLMIEDGLFNPARTGGEGEDAE